MKETRVVSFWWVRECNLKLTGKLQESFVYSSPRVNQFIFVPCSHAFPKFMYMCILKLFVSKLDIGPFIPKCFCVSFLRQRHFPT